jgi:hypothetical protein
VCTLFRGLRREKGAPFGAAEVGPQGHLERFASHARKMWLALNMPESLSDRYAELLSGNYDCADRIVLNYQDAYGQWHDSGYQDADGVWHHDSFRHVFLDIANRLLLGYSL